jgi:large subunit ribosomal protein L21
MVSNDKGVQVGTPLVEGAKVVATVLRQGKGPKLVVFKYKPKKRYRRKTGHRQNLTMLSIKEINI